MIYRVELKLESIQEDIILLNNAIQSNSEKKKRNEERIKYVFKRVNKLLLNKYMTDHGLESSDEDKAMEMFVKTYFGQDPNSNVTKKKAAYDRFFTLLFKPSNMYRKDLRDFFISKKYLEDFQETLCKAFLNDYITKRRSKIQSYIQDIKCDLFYSEDQSDSTILQKKVSRLPWSLSELEKGIAIFSEFVKLN
jgi:hypothetical protein